jgi:NADH-quinone oxidoreductase subunit M
MESWILTLITFIPLLGAIIVLLMPSRWEHEIKWTAIIISLIPLALTVWLWFAYNKAAGGMQFQVNVPWIPALHANYHIGVDGLSVPLMFLTGLLSTLGMYYSAYVIHYRVKEYFLLFLLLEMGLFGVFISLDFVLFYLFWEIGLVPMYLLIGVWGGEQREYAAIKFFLYTLAGSVFMMLAILGIYFNTGSFDILNAIQVHPFANNALLGAMAFGGFALAFGIKLPTFPFHTWLPDAHTQAPTAGSVLLAGVYLKLAAYGFLRMMPVFPGPYKAFAMLLIILGLISIIYGALVSMAQTNLKRLIAYSSVSHMGYILLGIGAAAMFIGATGAGTQESQALAMDGAALQMFTHGIITGALFFLAGMLHERSDTFDLNAFGGLGGKTPYYYGMFMVAGLASLGLPGLAGFWSEFFVFRGAFALVKIYAAIGVIGIVVTAAYILWRIIQSVFLGEFSEEKWKSITDKPLEDMEGFEKVTLWPMVFFMLLFGVWPTPLLDFFNRAALEILNLVK